MFVEKAGMLLTSVSDPDPAFYLNADPDPHLDPGSKNRIRIRILFRLCRHKKLDFDKKNIFYVGNMSKNIST